MVWRVLVSSSFVWTLLSLISSFTSVCGAYLQYGSTILSDPHPNVTLTVGVSNQRVYCIQATGSVPTSIEWYNPQGQLVSRNNRKEVNQQAAAGGRTSTLTFQSYQQSQGGKYECIVNVSGNNMEALPICIGELWSESSVSIHMSICQRLSLGPSMPTYSDIYLAGNMAFARIGRSMAIHAETVLGTTLLLNAFEHTPSTTHLVLCLLKNEMSPRFNETEHQQFIMPF